MSLEIQSILDKTASFSDLLTIAKRANAELSFWGTRYIVVNGYNGSLAIDALNRRVNDLLKNKPQWNEQTRGEGKLVATEVDRVYREIDAKESSSNILARIFMELRDLPSRIKDLNFTSNVSAYRHYWYPRGNKSGLCEIFDRLRLDYVKEPVETLRYFQIAIDFPEKITLRQTDWCHFRY